MDFEEWYKLHIAFLKYFNNNNLPQYHYELVKTVFIDAYKLGMEEVMAKAKKKATKKPAKKK